MKTPEGREEVGIKHCNVKQDNYQDTPIITVRYCTVSSFR